MADKKTSRKIIAFTGAGGTGKTTVAEAIKHNVPSLVDYLRKEYYGSESKYGDLTDLDEIIRFQYGILFAQFATEKMIKNIWTKTMIVPIERSSIDYGAYMLNQTEKYDLDKNLKTDIIRNYIDACIKHANTTYDGIVYFPTGKFTPSDQIGSSKERDDDSIHKTDRYINHILKRVNVPILRLNPTDLKLRVNAIYNFTKRLRKNRSDTKNYVATGNNKG